MQDKISEALTGAANAHHSAFIDLGGEDPNWHLWYARWLINESEIAHLLEEHFNTQTLGQFLLTLSGNDNHHSHDWVSSYTLKLHDKISQTV